ncbi:cytochrome P450 21 [Macroventuria anomochaeta]|uniref:Cytochrome P450 21 n=1 Tax=Macroventuria anomochaeta TaxID=301207 RepID=A0ACB6RXQ4_9PLEO|nr:cytochrome P450 21 [Macroventuria anomochaeta]KAF2626696.1 cytochrome P450 21 [Macroventuria anomochaeta]
MASNSAFIVQTVIGLVIVYVLISIVRFSLQSLPPKNYPPGPPSLPFIGNVHHFASNKLHIKFTEWRKTYGDIIGLKAGPANIVVLNSTAVTRELLERRGNIYSGRPTDYIFREHIVQDAQHILFLQNDTYLKRYRSAVRHLLGPAGCEQALPLQNAAATYLAYNLVLAPEKFQDHLHNWGMGTPLTAICGHRGAQKDKNLTKLFYDNQKNWLELLNPGSAPPIGMFPILKYVPAFLVKWKGQAKALRQNQQYFYYMMLNSAKDELKRSKAGNNGKSNGFLSLMATLLQEQGDKGGFDNHQLAYLGGGLLDAAVDTTYLSALAFIKALGAHPKVLKRAQAEVDSFSKAGKPPRVEDLDKLQYLKACFFEVLRWRPVATVNLPHTLDADDTFRGYHIPKGTVILQNIWIDSHDPTLFPAPDTFNPDRYLANPYGTDLSFEACQAEGRRISYAFGSGRRQCPGNVYAQNGFLAMAAKLVWAFDVKGRGELDLSVETGFHGGLLLGSEPFEVDFVPRSEMHRQVIIDDCERTRVLLD